VKKVKNVLQAFTFIEITVSILISASLLSVIGVTLLQSIQYRKQATDLKKASILAEKIMNNIKTQEKPTEEPTSVEDNPELTYDYHIKEESVPLPIDLGSSFGGTKSKAERTEELKEGSDFSNIWEMQMNVYTVNVHYRGDRTYTLKFLRGLDVAQSKQ